MPMWTVDLQKRLKLPPQSRNKGDTPPSASPGLGWHWGSEAYHAEVPRGQRVNVGTVGTLEEVLNGPSHTSDGSMNLFGALRRAMATCGYSDVKSFQRVEIIMQHGR